MVIIETLICSSLVASVVASPLSDNDVVAVEDGDTLTTVSFNSNSNDPMRLVEDCISTDDGAGDKLEPDAFAESLFDGSLFGCRDVQLWNIQKSSRIAVLCFPSKRGGSRSAIIPHVVFDSPLNGESKSQRSTTSLPERHFEPIVAVKMSHRRLVVFLDCPSAEIQIFDLKTLKLIHRLERSVVTVPNTLTSYACPPLGQQLRVGFFGKNAFFGATPTSSLASVGCLTIHPYLGYLVVPISVPAVDLNSGHPRNSGRFERFSLSTPRRHPPFPVADETLVAGVTAKGAFSQNDSIGSIGIIDILGEVKMMKSSLVHQNPIACISCNGAATMVVTASVKVYTCIMNSIQCHH